MDHSEDLKKIESVLAAYTAFGDSGRATAMAELFTDDGVLRVGGHPHAGRAAIVEFVERMGQDMTATGVLLPGLHHVGSRYVELSGPDTATSSSVFIFLAPHGPDHWGSYRDRMVRVESEWRIAERSVRFVGFAPGSAAQGVLKQIGERADG